MFYTHIDYRIHVVKFTQTKHNHELQASGFTTKAIFSVTVFTLIIWFGTGECKKEGFIGGCFGKNLTAHAQCV